jgi:hypothetical protein
MTSGDSTCNARAWFSVLYIYHYNCLYHDFNNIYLLYYIIEYIQYLDYTKKKLKRVNLDSKHMSLLQIKGY